MVSPPVSELRHPPRDRLWPVGKQQADHVHTLQSMTNWSTLRFEGSRRQTDPSDPGRHDGRYLLRVADVRRAGAFLAGARVLAAGLALPFPLPMASRMA